MSNEPRTPDAMQSMDGQISPRASAVTPLEPNASSSSQLNGGDLNNSSSLVQVSDSKDNSLEIGNSNSHHHQLNSDGDYEEDYDQSNNAGAAIMPIGGYWGRNGHSRPDSPSVMDNMSEISSQPPIVSMARPKSRQDMSTTNPLQSAVSKYSNLSYWKARRCIFYRNGDPFFPGVEFRFRPGRDITSLEALLDKISPKIDLPRGARYVFSMDGDRKYNLDELEDGASYVVSSFKSFKVS